jgi:hypothetical protein
MKKLFCLLWACLLVIAAAVPVSAAGNALGLEFRFTETAGNRVLGVELSWRPVTGADEYRITRDIDGPSDGSSYQRLTSNTSYSDSSAGAGKAYVYRVEALVKETGFVLTAGEVYTGTIPGDSGVGRNIPADSEVRLEFNNSDDTITGVKKIKSAPAQDINGRFRPGNSQSSVTVSYGPDDKRVPGECFLFLAPIIGYLKEAGGDAGYNGSTGTAVFTLQGNTLTCNQNTGAGILTDRDGNKKDVSSEWYTNGENGRIYVSTYLINMLANPNMNANPNNPVIILPDNQKFTSFELYIRFNAQ